MEAPIAPASGEAHASYEGMAAYYDEFAAHHNHELWISRLMPALEREGLSGRRLLDVACGTGMSFLPLLARGWEVTALDLSEAMVREAQRKAPTVHVRVADMRALPRLGQFDLVWALGDAVNYMSDVGELTTALAGMGCNLAPNGLLLFDTNTLRTYRTFYAETSTRRIGREWLVWRGQTDHELGPRGDAQATFEVGRYNGRGWERLVKAVHRQHHFPREDVLLAIERAGLECRATYGHGLDARLEEPVDEAHHTKAIYIAGEK